MNKGVDPMDQDDDVVVIEERDKHTIVYIVIAAVLGIALGGLAGSVATKSKWQNAYQGLEEQLKAKDEQQTEIVVQKVEAVEQKVADIDQEVERRVAQEVAVIREESEQERDSSRAMVTELEKVNLDLEQKVQTQSEEMAAQEKEIASLTRQIEMQNSVFARSRELFQRELIIKQDLAKLREERETLEPKLARYQRECDTYLEGKSFKVNSSACDKQDEVNSRMSQIDQMIEVHKLDLREIESIAASIGL